MYEAHVPRLRYFEESARCLWLSQSTPRIHNLTLPFVALPRLKSTLDAREGEDPKARSRCLATPATTEMELSVTFEARLDMSASSALEDDRC
jgi:hypothetical protein